MLVIAQRKETLLGKSEECRKARHRPARGPAQKRLHSLAVGHAVFLTHVVNVAEEQGVALLAVVIGEERTPGPVLPGPFGRVRRDLAGHLVPLHRDVADRAQQILPVPLVG